MILYHLGPSSQVRHKTTGAVYIVADSRLSQLPSTKTKGAAGAKAKPDVSKDAPADKGAAKKGDKKGDKKGSGHGTEPTAVDSSTYEVIDQCKGSALVGKKYVLIETLQWLLISYLTKFMRIYCMMSLKLPYILHAYKHSILLF